MDKKNRFSKWFSLGSDKPVTERQLNLVYVFFCFFILGNIIIDVWSKYRTRQMDKEFARIEEENAERRNQNRERRHQELMQLIKKNSLTSKTKGGGK